MIAITHHILVRLSATIAGQNPSTLKYIILGDDVVIANKPVAEAYVKLITGLGVKLSMQKSVVPVGPHICALEFASKFLVNGVNISPMPSGLVLEGSISATILLLTEFLKRQREYQVVDNP